MVMKDATPLRPLAHERNSIKCKPNTIHDPRGPEIFYKVMKYGVTFKTRLI